MDWLDVKLGDYIDLLTGFAFKSALYTEDTNDIKLVRGDNVAQGYLRWGGVKRWKSSEIDKFQKYNLELGDVILAMDRPWIEAGLKYAWVAKEDIPSLLVQRVSRMRGINGLLTDFLRFIIGSISFTDYIKPIVTGVAVPHISSDQIKAFSFKLPPFPIQRKIAVILSAYDDLIENNTRRIHILEQMAQAVYHEWFGKVDPKSLPKGWEMVKVGERFSTVLGGTPSRKKQEYWENGTIPWINSSKCNELRVTEPSEYITELGLNSSSTKMMPKRTTIIAITGATLGQVSLTEIETCANQSIVGVWDEENIYTEYIYLKFKDIINEVIQHAGGAAQQHINKEIVNEFMISIPSCNLIKKFQLIVQPIFNLLENLVWKNANLRKTRDLLLPRLVSGEVGVEGIEIGELP